MIPTLKNRSSGFALNVVVFLILSSKIAAQSLSYKNLQRCDEVVDTNQELFAPEHLKLETLPQGLYLVRSVVQSLESQTGERYVNYQKLLTEQDRFSRLCFNGSPLSELKVQTFFPTVIDQTKEKKWGHAFWSMMVSARKASGAVEANRSLVPAQDYRQKLSEQGFQVEQRQIHHQQYELRLTRDVASWKETVIVLYDQY